MSPIDRLSLSELRTAARRLADLTQYAESLFATCGRQRIACCEITGSDSDLPYGRMHALVLLGLIDPARLNDVDKLAWKAMADYAEVPRTQKRTAESQAAATTTPQDPQS